MLIQHVTNLFRRWQMQRRTVRSVTSWCLATKSTSRQSTTPRWLKERSCCVSPPHHTTRPRWCSTLSVRPVWVLLLRQKYLKIDFFPTNNPNTICPVGLSSLEYIKQWIWLVNSTLCLVAALDRDIDCTLQPCLDSFDTVYLTLLDISDIHSQWQRRSYPQLFALSTDRLVKTWKEAGLELRQHSSAECDFCQQPLHFELMSEREKSYFTGLSHISAVAWSHIKTLNPPISKAIYYI